MTLKLEFFKNFNIREEIEIAGNFVYNAISILNSTNDIFDKAIVFLFLYNCSVAVERLQKCVLLLFDSYNMDNFQEYIVSIKKHNHQYLQNKIQNHTKKPLPQDQNALLALLNLFYKNGRYASFSISETYDCKRELESFIVNTYPDSKSIIDTIKNNNYIPKEAKELIGRTLGKLISYYYSCIYDMSSKLNLYSYELSNDSFAQRVLQSKCKFRPIGVTIPLTSE